MRRVIPCQTCKAPACELELPVFGGVAAQMFRSMLRVLSANAGFALDPDCENPLDAVPAEAIAEILNIRCLECVMLGLPHQLTELTWERARPREAAS